MAENPDGGWQPLEGGGGWETGLSAERTIDEPCRRAFEAARRSGSLDPLEQFLPANDSPCYLATLEELVCIDVEFAWKDWSRQGGWDPRHSSKETLRSPEPVEGYLARFPALRQGAIVRRLVKHECLVRVQAGMRISPSEYRRRFPDLSLVASPTEAVAASQSEADTVPETGERWIGQYRIVRQIGRGGMGLVYEAEQPSLARRVALKVLPALVGEDPELRARLRDEARAAASLDHPNIIPVYEVGEQDDQAFFSMKLVSGSTLAERLSAGPMEPRAAAELLLPICRAVAAAHHAGVVHRDLKPANILLEADGRPLVADFGLARFIQEETMTLSGTVAGTPSYMAPEQALGDRETIGCACDVYGLGAILYHTLTGRPPFQAASAVETMMMVVEEEPLPPRLVNSRADPALEAIAVRCLQKPIHLRYSTADALADDLQAYLNDEPVQARSPRVRDVVSRLLRDSRYVAALEQDRKDSVASGVFLLIYCVMLNALAWIGIHSVGPYLLMQMGALSLYIVVFLISARGGTPVTFVERQVAAFGWVSAYSCLAVFLMEWALDLPALTLSPLLAVNSSIGSFLRANFLSRLYYTSTVAYLLCAVAMACMVRLPGPDLRMTLLGCVLFASGFIPRWIERRRQARLRTT